MSYSYLEMPLLNAGEHELLLKLFDASFYLAKYRDVLESGIDPFLHFMEYGAAEGRSPHPLFDTSFYLLHHPDATQSGLNPLLHFLHTGVRAGANPHPLFDTVYYLDEYPDVEEAGLNPLIHFVEEGAVKKRNPHPFFNSAAYLAANPDVAASGVNPLIHYVCSGEAEGRPIYRVVVPPESREPHFVTAGREQLRRELSIARMQTVQLTRELKGVYERPAWRSIIDRRNRPTKRQTEAGVPTGELPRNRAAQLPGELLLCRDPKYMERTFYCHDGKRHWVPSEDHLRSYCLSKHDVRIVNDDKIQQYALAGALPMPWPAEVWDDPVRCIPHDVREISTSRLRGSGIEFGAGTGPMAVPLHCDVKFADLFSNEDLTTRAYTAQGSDFARVSYVMGMEDMSKVTDSSLDFVIACHVIEHLRNPLRALEQVYRKLKPGGQYVLVVPEKRLTFDRDRELTTLDHLVADYEEPSAERDLPHYFEFYRKVYFIPEELLAQRVQDAVSGNHDLHYHTWTYESFGEMVKYARGTFSPWRSVWSQTAIWEDPGALEFYFLLEK